MMTKKSNGNAWEKEVELKYIVDDFKIIPAEQTEIIFKHQYC